VRLCIPNRLVQKVDMAATDYEMLRRFDVLEQGKDDFIGGSRER